ncbi:MAG TPA: glycosyltransferase family 2 protein [Bacteroidia bacterium]|nr:glycosyltransferase family 2 protein [Bacteroidia bacterium]
MAFSVSIILPVINETFSLKQTIDIIATETIGVTKEYIIVVCEKTLPASRTTIKELQTEYGDQIVVLEQKLPFLGGAIRDAFSISTGSHVIIMSSDLETNPAQVKELIALSEQNPEKIITTSRWKQKGGFKGYNPVKLGLSWVFQKFFSALYHTHLTDMTYGYRIFPATLIRSIHWEELRHPFVFETIIKPLKLGVDVIEIPTNWEARKEGESQNTFLRNFEYFRIGLKVLFYSKEKILKG